MLGSTEPRLFTPPLVELTPATSLGFECIDFIEAVLLADQGQKLLPWQRWFLIHALELRDNGKFRFRNILMIIGRQNGKTQLITWLLMWAMVTGRSRNIMAVAQSLSLAEETLDEAIGRINADDELRAMKLKVIAVNGKKELRLTNGTSYKTKAANREAARGQRIDLLFIDELREQRDWLAWGALSKTTSNRPNPLTIATSNAGDASSVVLNSQRESALTGTSTSLGLFEWSAPESCALDDRQAWAQANPSLNYLDLTDEVIEGELATDPPDVFRTERLCQYVEAMGAVAVQPGAWESCVDSQFAVDLTRDRIALCVDVSIDLEHATLCMASQTADGRFKVGVLASWESTATLVADLPSWIEKIDPEVFGWFPGGPAAALKPEFEPYDGQEMRAGDAAAACMGFADLVAGGKLLHNGDPLLTNHVLGAKKWPVGDGWRFVRKGVGHVDAAYAAAGAVFLARSLPEEQSVDIHWL